MKDSWLVRGKNHLCSILKFNRASSVPKDTLRLRLSLGLFRTIGELARHAEPREGKPRSRGDANFLAAPAAQHR